MSFQVGPIDHVEVFVRDVEAAVRWYGEVLGLRELPDRPWPQPVMIGVGGTKIALFAARRDGPDNADDDGQPPIRWRRLAWGTSEAGFAQAQAHLDRLGIPFKGPVDHGVSHSIYFNDPDGNPLEITFYLEQT